MLRGEVGILESDAKITLISKPCRPSIGEVRRRSNRRFEPTSIDFDRIRSGKINKGRALESDLVECFASHDMIGGRKAEFVVLLTINSDVAPSSDERGMIPL